MKGALRIAVAGASGFVGTALVQALAGRHRVIALARSTRGRPETRGVEWRSCDLFNLRAAEAGLEGAEVAGVRPRLEFRAVLDGAFVLSAINDFVPRLPWLVYVMTQALFHLWVMRSFGRHLAREDDAPARPAAAPTG